MADEVKALWSGRLHGLDVRVVSRERIEFQEVPSGAWQRVTERDLLYHARLRALEAAAGEYREAAQSFDRARTRYETAYVELRAEAREAMLRACKVAAEKESALANLLPPAPAPTQDEGAKGLEGVR